MLFAVTDSVALSDVVTMASVDTVFCDLRKRSEVKISHVPLSIWRWHRRMWRRRKERRCASGNLQQQSKIVSCKPSRRASGYNYKVFS